MKNSVRVKLNVGIKFARAKYAREPSQCSLLGGTRHAAWADTAPPVDGANQVTKVIFSRLLVYVLKSLENTPKTPSERYLKIKLS